MWVITLGLPISADGSWGRIEAKGELFTPYSTDWKYPSDIRVIDQSSAHSRVFRARLSDYVDSVNNEAIPYRALFRNSNSFAYQGIELLGYDRPATNGFTPAAQALLVH